MNIGAANRFSYSQMMMEAAAAKSAGAKGTQPEFTLGVDIDIEVEVSEIESTAPAAPQTVDDVKKEFYDYLDSLQLSPGLSRTPISVNVTEAAFEKMLADPEYKQKMKDLCARDLCDPNWNKRPPAGINITIDADCPEEYLAGSWNSGANMKTNRDGFWTRRTDKSATTRKDQEKRSQEKKELLQFLQERADERRMLSRSVSKSDIFPQSLSAYSGSSLLESLTGAGTASAVF